MKTLLLMLLPLFLVPGFATGSDSPIANLVSDLDSSDALVVARAQAALDALDSSSVAPLKEALGAQISVRSRALLFQKLNTILTGMLAELDTAVTDFSAARRQARNQAGASAQKSAARKTARTRVEKIEHKLSASDLFLAPALARHEEQTGTAVQLVLRVRERLRESLRQQVKNRWPAPTCP